MSDNKILDAVKQLDKANDTHWTADGLPRLEAVRELASDTSLTREQVEAAAPGFKRPHEAAEPAPPAPPAEPTPPPPPPQTPSIPPTPTVPEGAAPGAEPPEQDEGVRGDIGVATEQPLPGTPQIDGSGGPVPPEDVDGENLPQPEPLPTAPAADGLPTAKEPTATEGAPGVGLTAEDVSGRSGPGGDGTPEITLGVTGQGVNTIATPESDLEDALATVAPSPNAPTGLGGPLEPDELVGINADGLRATADATGEDAVLTTLDRGHPGNPEAIPGLEKELEAAAAKTAKLRAESDKIQAKLNESAANESRIRAAIEAARPVSGHMEAVQGWFGAQDSRAEGVAVARQQILDSGVDLKALGRLTQRSPLDAAKQPQDR
jgi:hypothetical protein